MTHVAGTPGSAPAELPLAAEFADAGRADWERLVEGVLAKSGGRPEDLVTMTDDGIEIQPLYTAAEVAEPSGFPGLPPFVRGSQPQGHTTTGWDIRARHADPDPAATNDAVLADLEGGATSVWLRVRPGSLAEALHGVHIDMAPVVLDPGADYAATADELLGLFAERGVPDAGVTGNLGADPIGLRARTGQAHDVAPAAELAARVPGRCPALRTLVADALPYHEAGGSDAQELGASIATGVAYLRALTGAGLSVAEAAAQLEFRYAATANQFLTIAKLRAARRLWARVTEVSGAGDGVGMRQHAVTSQVMLTQRDPWVNLLRGTLACFAAGVAGADAVTVLPLDSAIGLPDAFSRRVARNTQAILLEESRLAGVIDPAGGSWYVERLTDELAHAAWDEFTAIERAGGIEAELASGALAGRLAVTWEKREQRVATREDPITGVSEFPLLDEEPLRRAEAPATSGVDGGGLPRVRTAQHYEELRDRADAYLAANGRRPRVFLATLGSLASHTARTTFATNLFAAGGIEAVTGTPEEYDGTIPVVCLCGSDSTYAEQAAGAAKTLRSAGATDVLLAGKPGDYEGVNGFVHTGCDALAVLADTLDKVGANR